MLNYIIRLDDACPNMNHDKWRKVENLLDKYNIKPIVGIIPESKDQLFIWNKDEKFWDITVKRYIEKEWIIAQHGCYHLYHLTKDGKYSEFIGLSYEEQFQLIKRGYDILISHGVKPRCFFAPAHSFDDLTIDVCRDIGYFDFISDGNSLYPYKYKGMLFYPNLFDTPCEILPFGIYTFVLHPNFITDKSLENLERFIIKNKKYFRNFDEIDANINKNRKRSFLDKSIKMGICFIRKLRKIIYNK